MSGTSPLSVVSDVISINNILGIFIKIESVVKLSSLNYCAVELPYGKITTK